MHFQSYSPFPDHVSSINNAEMQKSVAITAMAPLEEELLWARRIDSNELGFEKTCFYSTAYYKS
jgi:hypothetical protein